MNTLTELYNQQIVPLDDELEKEASDMLKMAQEHEYAGRIMARGFADELNKLAAPDFSTASPIKDMGKGTTVKSKGYEMSGQSRKGEGQAIFSKRKGQAPAQQGSRPQKQIAKSQDIGANKGMFGAKPGVASQFASKGGGGGMMGSAVGAPKAKAGSVVGKMNFGTKMPSLAAK